MKKIGCILLIVFAMICCAIETQAQCSLCTKTAQQMGEKPAQGLNSGILYLMISPFAIVGVIGYKWWKNNKAVEADDNA